MRSPLNFVGQKIHRLDIKTEMLQGATFGQNATFKVITSFFCLSLFLVCVLISGWWGGLLGLNFSVPGDAYKTWFYLPPSIAVSMIWLWLTAYGNFEKSLTPTLVTAIATIIVLHILDRIPLPWETTAFTSDSIDTFEYAMFMLANLMITTFIYAILQISFYLVHFVSGLSNRIKIFKYLLVLLLSLSAALSAVWFLSLGGLDNRVAKTLREQNLLPTFLPQAAFLGGLLFGGVMSSAAIIAKPTQSIMDLARKCGTWKGTSFYNMDLSHIDFSNAYLANCDFRVRRLYRTCLKGATGLDKARVDNRYINLKNIKVQRLLTDGISKDSDFSKLNLRGAFLKKTDLRKIIFSDTDLSGADCRYADLRGAIFSNAQVKDVDFSYAKLTGICIKGWVVDSNTYFSNAVCDYVFRDIDSMGEPISRFPVNRNFNPREFESLYQDISNVANLILQEGDDWQSALFSLKKLQIEDESLGLELKGIEKRGNLWVLKVIYNETQQKQNVERILDQAYCEMSPKLKAQEERIDKLLGIVDNLSKKENSNHFTITGGFINNLSGSGKIGYNHVVNQVHKIIESDDSSVAVEAAQQLSKQLQKQDIASTIEEQTELLMNVLIEEAKTNEKFRKIVGEQGYKIAMSTAQEVIREALAKAVQRPE